MDEIGPIVVKSYPWEEWKEGPNRSAFAPIYKRRGKLFVHGAFEPAIRKGITILSPSWDSASHVQLLEKGMTSVPGERWLIIEDYLSIHVRKPTKLALAA